MRYRGVRIVRIKEVEVRDGRPDCYGNPTFREVEVTKGFSPVGVRYPYSLAECKDAIDRLITAVMRVCDVGERRAVALLNEAC